VRVDVALPGVGGVTLRGWLYRPPGDGPVPGVVMAHGFSAVKEMHLDRFAEVFAAAGLAVLVYDHRNLGASDGPVRGDIDPEEQVADYSEAVTWLASQPGVDPGRIGSWGSSYSGGHVLVVAARDRRVRAVVSQVPFVRSPVAEVPGPLAEALAVDGERRGRGASPIMLPVVGSVGTTCVMPTPDARDYFTRAAIEAPSWRNSVTMASIGRLMRWNPADEAERISAPVLLIGARGDDLTPYDGVVEVAASLRAPHRVVALDGGHFDPYVARFGEASVVARDWFVEVLRPS
jgi:dipeptidyl aminopeptidase/acylaminoacyl peptidase